MLLLCVLYLCVTNVFSIYWELFSLPKFSNNFLLTSKLRETAGITGLM